MRGGRGRWRRGRAWAGLSGLRASPVPTPGDRGCSVRTGPASMAQRSHAAGGLVTVNPPSGPHDPRLRINLDAAFGRGLANPRGDRSARLILVRCRRCDHAGDRRRSRACTQAIERTHRSGRSPHRHARRRVDRGRQGPNARRAARPVQSQKIQPACDSPSGGGACWGFRNRVNDSDRGLSLLTGLKLTHWQGGREGRHGFRRILI